MKKQLRDRQKDRSNWFCCVSNDPETMEHLKESVKNFRRWFYIIHQPDSEDSKPHIHCMLMYGGSCYIRTVARVLGIPENFVQFCDSHKAYAQYMIHMHSPEKIQYKPEDVQTNFPGLYKSMIVDSANDDVMGVFDDIRALEAGRITITEFCERHYYELQSMPLYQKIQTYKSLSKFYRDSSVRPT